MAQLQHTALLGRRLSEGPPRGKGARLAVTAGPVQGLCEALLQIPARVLARLDLISPQHGPWSGPYISWVRRNAMHVLVA
jgi:hypothetical protein